MKKLLIFTQVALLKPTYLSIYRNGAFILQTTCDLPEGSEVERKRLQVCHWDTICWFGSLNGEAALFFFACDEAVARDPDNGSFRNSRGLARALTDDKQGAIDDFQAFIQWLDRTKPENAAALKAQRQRWINDLQAGKPPSAIFTKDVLEQLRGQ